MPTGQTGLNAEAILEAFPQALLLKNDSHPRLREQFTKSFECVSRQELEALALGVSSAEEARENASKVILHKLKKAKMLRGVVSCPRNIAGRLRPAMSVCKCAPKQTGSVLDWLAAGIRSAFTSAPTPKPAAIMPRGAGFAPLPRAPALAAVAKAGGVDGVAESVLADKVESFFAWVQGLFSAEKLTQVWSNIGDILTVPSLKAVLCSAAGGFVIGLLDGLLRDVLASIVSPDTLEKVLSVWNKIKLGLGVAGIVALLVTIITGGWAVITTMLCSMLASAVGYAAGRLLMRGVNALLNKLGFTQLINIERPDAHDDSDACPDCGPGHLHVGECLAGCGRPADTMVLAVDNNGIYECGHVSFCYECFQDAQKDFPQNLEKCSFCRREIVHAWQLEDVATDCPKCLHMGVCVGCRSTINAISFPTNFQGPYFSAHCSKCIPPADQGYANMRVRFGGLDV